MQNFLLTLIALSMGAMVMKSSDKRAKLTTGVLALMIGLVWLNSTFVTTIAFIAGSLFVLVVAMQYLAEEHEAHVKAAVSVGGFLFSLKMIYSMMNLPFSHDLLHLQIVAFFLFIWFLYKGGLKRPEFTFLTIIQAIFIVQFMDFYAKFL